MESEKMEPIKRVKITAEGKTLADLGALIEQGLIDVKPPTDLPPGLADELAVPTEVPLNTQHCIDALNSPEHPVSQSPDNETKT